MATLAGRRHRAGRIPGTATSRLPERSRFFVCGGLAGVLVAWWCRPNVTPTPDLWFSIAAPLVAALVAALVETIPIRLDDNISVPASAAAVLWALSLVRRSSSDRALAAGGQRILLAARRECRRRVAGLSGAHGDNGRCGGRRDHRHRDRGDDRLARLGAAAGDVSGGIGQFAARPAPQDAPRHRRRARRTAGRRETPIANTGLATIAALLAVSTLHRDLALLAFVTALAAGGSDTIASEIGKAWGRRTYLVSTFKRARRELRARCPWKGRSPASPARPAGGGRIAVGLIPPACARCRRRRIDDRLARRKPARCDARGSGYPEQRHVELPQHGDRRGRRDFRRGAGGMTTAVARRHCGSSSRGRSRSSRPRSVSPPGP